MLFENERVGKGSGVICALASEGPFRQMTPDPLPELEQRSFVATGTCLGFRNQPNPLELWGFIPLSEQETVVILLGFEVEF